MISTNVFRKQPAILAYSACILILGPVLGCMKIENKLATPPPPEVLVAKPVKGLVGIPVEFTGVTEAVSSAEVRSRVRGFIQKVHFSPGATVAGPGSPEVPGDVLYDIEPDEYRAALEAATASENAAKATIQVADAQVRVAKSMLDRASREKDRQTELRKQNVSSSAEYEAAVANFRSAEAEVTAAEAAVQLAIAQHQQSIAARVQAELDLGYTTIRAPISGQVTKTLVKEGNLVESGTYLADVVDASRVYVNFSVSDREALRYLDLQRAQGLDPANRQAEWSQQKVLLARETDNDFLFEGQLDYVDQLGVDPNTGTLGLRALFENSQRILLPGLFVRLRLPPREKTEALLIPQKCVSRDSRSTYVMTVGADGKVAQQNVKIGQRIDGWVLVEEGLDENTTVIVEGLQKTQPGGTVSALATQLQINDPWFE